MIWNPFMTSYSQRASTKIGPRTSLLSGRAEPPFQNTFGVLDAGGGASASMTIPGGLYSFYATAHHAFLAFDAFGVIRMASPAVPLFYRP